MGCGRREWDTRSAAANVARMSEATSGTGLRYFPGCRFAHPGYDVQLPPAAVQPQPLIRILADPVLDHRRIACMGCGRREWDTRSAAANVARMSEATSGTGLRYFPGCRFAHPGYDVQLPPAAVQPQPLIRILADPVLDHRRIACMGCGRREWDTRSAAANVARMSEATSGAGLTYFPGCRFAHPGYDVQLSPAAVQPQPLVRILADPVFDHRRIACMGCGRREWDTRSAAANVARMSEATSGAGFTCFPGCRVAHPGYDVQLSPAAVQPQPLVRILANPALDHRRNRLHGSLDIDFPGGIANRLHFFG